MRHPLASQRSMTTTLGYLLLVFPGFAWADDSTNIVSIFQNLDISLNEIYPMLVGLSYLLGVWFCIQAFYDLKKQGYKTAFMHAGSGILGPIAKMFVGIALLYAPSMIKILMYTIWGYTSVQNTETWQAAQGDSNWIQVISPMVGLIQTIGIISFIRGWILVSKSIGENAPPGNAGKGWIHIIGSVFAINITGTIDLVRHTLGL